MDIIRGDNAIDTGDYFGRVVKSTMLECKKVCFDLKQLKKIEKVYSSYKIPKTAKIIAFCRGNIPFAPLTVEGVVFTNYAVYYYPPSKTEEGLEKNCILYSSLGSYIITQDGPKGAVHAQTMDEEIRLLGPSIISQNTAGMEVRRILCRIQKCLFHKNSAEKNKFDTLAAAAIREIEKKMSVEELPRRYDAILSSLMEFPAHADATAMLKAEYLYREFRPQKYESFVESIPEQVSLAVRSRIKEIPDDFPINYIRLLTDVQREFKYQSLSNAYESCCALDKQDQRTGMIQAYLCIRMNNYNWTCMRISYLREDYGSEVANEVEWFRCVYGYHEMQKIYDTIKKQEELPSVCTKYRDGLGLTPLHYAILLNDEKAMTNLLGSKDWIEATPYQGDVRFVRMYEYVVLASGKQLPNVGEILLKTHRETIKLRNAIKTTRAKLKFQNIVRDLQDWTLYTQQLNYTYKQACHASHEEIKAQRKRIATIRSSMEVAQGNAESLAEMLEEYEQEIKLVMEDAVMEALELLEETRNGNDPVSKYLYRIYFEPDFFEQVLSAIKEQRRIHLYKYHGFYFIAPEFAEIDLPCQEATAAAVGQDNTMPAGKPLYGNSWFSHAAHGDIDKLKSEYRKLAKTYHPDVSNQPNSNQLFQDISNEYQVILQSLCDRNDHQ